jgi:hypothetical protein
MVSDRLNSTGGLKRMNQIVSFERTRHMIGLWTIPVRIYLARDHSIRRWNPTLCCIFHIMCLSLLFPFLKQQFILVSFCFATPFVDAQLALKIKDLPFASLVIVILLF